MRYSLFCDVTQRRLIVSFRRFQTAFPCGLQGLIILKTNFFGLRPCVNFLSLRLSNFMVCTPEMVLRDDNTRNKWWTGYTANMGKRRCAELRRFAASNRHTFDCQPSSFAWPHPKSPVILRVTTSDNQSVCSL